MCFKKTFVIVILASLILLLVEFVSMQYLQRLNKAKSFLILASEDKDSWQTKNQNYNTIDPLLGWAANQENIQNLGWTWTNNCILLEHLNLDQIPIKIYISGGSASDLLYDKENWPAQLLDEFVQRNIAVQIYVAAVAGYNSGQEVLKTLRDIQEIKADIHISYSGANEMEENNYVSLYEHHNLSALIEPRSSKLFPNTISLLQELLSRPKSQAKILELNKLDAPIFWEQNMRNLHALSQEYNYTFVGVLQAVFNFMDKENSNEIPIHYIEDYQYFFPKAIALSENYTYLYDFSSKFKDEDAFLDDCHLKHIKYQKEIAQAMYKIIDTSYFSYKPN